MALGALLLAVVLLQLVTIGADILERFLDSDTLYLAALYDDLLRADRDLRCWSLTPSPYFVPDMPLFFLCRAVLADPGTAYVLYGFVWFTLFLALLWRLASLTQASPGGALVYVLAAGVALLWLVEGRGGGPQSLVYLLVPSYHGGTVLCGLALLALRIGAMVRGRSRWGGVVATGVLVLVATLSDQLVVVQFLLPMVAATGLFVLAGRVALAELWVQLGAIGGGVALARGALEVLHRARVFHLAGALDLGPLLDLGWDRVPLPFRLRTAWGDLGGLAAEYPELVAAAALWTMVSLVAVVLVVREVRPTSRPGPRAVSRERFVPLFLPVFWLFSLVAVCCYPVVLGPYWGMWPVRYFLPLFVLPLPLGAIVAAPFGRPGLTRIKGGLAAILAVVALAGSLPAALGLGAGSLSLPYPHRVRRLDELARHHGLTVGYADYWNARYLTQLSRAGLSVTQVDFDLSPSHHTVDLCAYRRASADTSARLFILPDRLDLGAILDLCGEPELRLRADDMIVLVFDRAACDALIQKLAAVEH
jgi:hypothetical protein